MGESHARVVNSFVMHCGYKLSLEFWIVCAGWMCCFLLVFFPILYYLLTLHDCLDPPSFLTSSTPHPSSLPRPPILHHFLDPPSFITASTPHPSSLPLLHHCLDPPSFITASTPPTLLPQLLEPSPVSTPVVCVGIFNFIIFLAVVLAIVGLSIYKRPSSRPGNAVGNPLFIPPKDLEADDG